MRIPNKHRREQSGFLMIALIVIVSIMLLYVAATARVLSTLNREINGLERSQVKRIEKVSAVRSSPDGKAVSPNSPAQ